MNKLKYLTNKQLVDIINDKYANNYNDDDYIAELVRRRKKYNKQIAIVQKEFDIFTETGTTVKQSIQIGLCDLSQLVTAGCLQKAQLSNLVSILLNPTILFTISFFLLFRLYFHILLCLAISLFQHKLF